MSLASEAIGAVRTVRTFVREKKLQEEFRSVQNLRFCFVFVHSSFSTAICQSYVWGSKSAVAWGLFQGAITIVSQGAIALVIWYGSTLILAHDLDLSNLIAFMLYSITLAASAGILSSVFGTVMQVKKHKERCLSFDVMMVVFRVPPPM